jgi:hypothetical protein
MGSKLSSHATGSVKIKEPVGVRGHTTDSETQLLSTASETCIQTTYVVTDEVYDSDDSDSVDISLEDGEAEPDDFFGERNAVLADCHKLALMARFYSHPEVSVKTVHPCLGGRCYFDRPSAPEVKSVEDAEVHAQILADMANLKKLATDYMHPELPATVSDPSTMARCYFDRPSAPEVESVEESEARAQILSDMAALKKLARDYMHPELPVIVSDPSATARCYFDRPSAPQVESVDETEYRDQILADALAMKKSATDYLHPELPVVSTDPTATARCYFDRASAPDVESVEETDNRDEVFADLVALKKSALDYLHPELPVVATDLSATARCFFDRASAPDVESVEEAESRAQILSDALAMKKLAIDYLHPELPVVVTDPSATARCFFDRASVTDVESMEEAEYRAKVFADVAALKKVARDYMHPECAVVVTDPSATARCYFDRPSAPEVECVEDAEARAQILSDMAALKKLAKDYMHPELPVTATDPSATARCYFDRPSADVTTFMSHVSVVDTTDEFARARSDTEQFDFEDDVFHDMKDRFTRFSRAHSFGVEEESKVIDKEEEGHLSRSPSSVMLFDMVGERAS